MVKWEFFLIPCWLIFCSEVCSFYKEFYCPPTLEWILRGRWYCTKYKNPNGEYSCLFNDITKVYEESCRFEAHPLDRGEEYVLKHNPTGVACIDESRYQPFGFHRFQNGCVFQRTKCSESGQVVYHIGNSTENAICRCNFKEGYAFIKTPKAVCSCTPSEEDCSCYLKICEHDYELTADYKCVHKNNKSYFPSCPQMYLIGVDNKIKYNKQVISEELKIEDQDQLKFLIGARVLLVMCLVFTVVVCTLVTSGSIPSICLIHINSPHNLKVLQEGKTLKMSWSKGENEDSSETKYIVYVTYSDTWEDDKTRCITVDTGKLHCYLTSIFLPSKTYRFKVSACKNDIESKACDEVTFETGLPKKPNDIITLHKEGNVLLQWAPPDVSLFEIDKYRIQYTTDDTWTNPPTYKLADSLEYVIENAIPHSIYRFKICACSQGFEGEKLECLYSTDHAFEGKLNLKPSEQNGNERIIGEHVRKVLVELLKDFPGIQTMLTTDVKFSSVIVFFIFISHGFYDETEMRERLEQKFKKVVIGQLSLSLCDLTLRSLNNPEPPQSVRAENAGHNVVKLIWKEPKKTFFKTEQFIVQYTTDNWVTEKKELVSPNNTSYYIYNVLPATAVKLRIYSEICHSITSVASNVAGTSVEDQESLEDTKYGNAQVNLEKDLESLEDTKYGHAKANLEKDLESLEDTKYGHAKANLEKDMESLKETQYEHAQVHLEEDQFTLSNQFTLARNAGIRDLVQLPNGLLVLAVCNTRQLITYRMNGEGDKTVKLKNCPSNIAAVDDNTVVVSMLGVPVDYVKCDVVSVIDIETGNVTRSIGTFKSCNTEDSLPIIYANGKLFIHSNYGEISVIDLYGTKKTKIMLKDDMTILSSMCYDFKTNSIYGTTSEAPGLIRINREGTCDSVFEFSNHDFAFPRNVCVGNKGGVLVICEKKPPRSRNSQYHVYRIKPNGKSFRRLITLPLLWEPSFSCIVYHLDSNTIIIAYGSTIFVYKTTEIKTKNIKHC